MDDWAQGFRSILTTYTRLSRGKYRTKRRIDEEYWFPFPQVRFKVNITPTTRLIFRLFHALSPLEMSCTEPEDCQHLKDPRKTRSFSAGPTGRWAFRMLIHGPISGLHSASLGTIFRNGVCNNFRSHCKVCRIRKLQHRHIATAGNTREENYSQKKKKKS